MNVTIHIKASDDTEFYQQIAAFAYGSYAQHGFGAVVITQGEFLKNNGGNIEAHVMYVPHSEDEALLPEEAIEFINDYDPERECVLAMVESTGKATCITLTAQQMGSNPKRLFEEAIKIQQHVPVISGTLVRLKESIGDVDPGFLVFLGEDKSEMILARVGEDDEGDVVATDEVHRVHMDYWEYFRATGITMFSDE